VPLASPKNAVQLFWFWLICVLVVHFNSTHVGKGEFQGTKTLHHAVSYFFSGVGFLNGTITLIEIRLEGRWDGGESYWGDVW